jgi:hypothetical protein
MDVGARPIKALRCSLNDTTLLHRQINPSWVQQGRVTSQAFRPTPKDESKLSVMTVIKLSRRRLGNTSRRL